MSIPKAVGIEQEYAIKIKGDDDLSAFHASCMLVNAYAGMIGLRGPDIKMLWDYGHETPYQDIRGLLFNKNVGQEIVNEEENRLINAPLPNGARLYTDHAHPEYSTPECLSARDVVACDKAGERILERACQSVNAALPGSKIFLYKNNIDHQGHSYGCHENYLMEAEAHEKFLVRTPQYALRTLVPFLVTRQLFAGAGKVGEKTPYQISQRADFIENVFGLETMFARPIINTRQEHHADPNRFRRLHIIIGDANCCELAGFLKIGSTQIILQMIEDEFIAEDFTLKNPVRAAKQISTRFDCPIELADGRIFTALQLQQRFLAWAREYRGGSDVPHVPEEDFIYKAWAEALDGLEQIRISPEFVIEDDPSALKTKLDWVLKLWLLNRYRRGKDIDWDHPQLKVLDLQYHNIDVSDSVFYRLQDQGLTERLLGEAEIDRFIRQAPDDTRAYFRGKCLEKFAQDVYLINWEVVGFDLGEIYRMIPLLNPLKGACRQFEETFNRSRTVRELLAFLETGHQK